MKVAYCIKISVYIQRLSVYEIGMHFNWNIAPDELQELFYEMSLRN